MIDDAIAVERTGLHGTCYIDMRRAKRGSGYYDYDQDLAELYLRVLKETDLPVVVDRSPDLFKPGTCPDTALYFGWHSAGEYIPAFTFTRGAVAVHLASFELVSLRDPNKGYWCPNLLRDGVAATFGPTAEPYLDAFPKPSHFFGLLLSGERSLVECFYRAKPYNSWQLALIGDPLYRPFAASPKLDSTDPD